ncbi:MAG: hypothetical protein ABSG17_11300 [Spirochaetia bacterium]|jgi:hypothetical protein
MSKSFAELAAEAAGWIKRSDLGGPTERAQRNIPPGVLELLRFRARDLLRADDLNLAKRLGFEVDPPAPPEDRELEEWDEDEKDFDDDDEDDEPEDEESDDFFSIFR